MNQTGGMLFLRALTPVHAGAGPSLGAVDLPLQRESHTGWPMIQGSSLKGALRELHREHLVEIGDCPDAKAADAHAVLRRLYGAQGADQAGALAVTDARLLALPARSAAGVFAWVTCPAALERLDADLALAGLTPLQPGGLYLPDDTALAPPAAVARLKVANLAAPGGGEDAWALLEEIAVKLTSSLDGAPASPSPVEGVAAWLAQQALGLPAQANGRFFDPRNRLLVLSDTAFALVVETGTEIHTRVALDDDKRVRQGPFTEELFPSESLLYSVLLDLETPAPSPAAGASVIDLVDGLLQQKNQRFQLGGDESLGKGWLGARLERT